jgi:hypothetical protein
MLQQCGEKFSLNFSLWKSLLLLIVIALGSWETLSLFIVIAQRMTKAKTCIAVMYGTGNEVTLPTSVTANVLV